MSFGKVGKDAAASALQAQRRIFVLLVRSRISCAAVKINKNQATPQ